MAVVNKIVLFLFLIFLSATPQLSCAQPSDSAQKSWMADLRAGHPRLLFLKEDEERIDTLRRTDPFFARLVDISLHEAEINLSDSVIAHRKIGKRLLHQCRESLSRITHLANAYRLTGDRRFLVRAEQEMLPAASRIAFCAVSS